MPEQLYTIPINEAFDHMDGCPLCHLRNKLEKQSLDYIMGAAMMEPDIRIVTNRLGFCKNHFQKLLGMGNRLSLALMLESHLAEIAEGFPAPNGKKPGKLGKLKKYDGENPAHTLLSKVHSCYVCSRVAEFEKKYVSNVVYIWKKDEAFREKLRHQPYFCLEHGAMLLETGQAELSEVNYLQFSGDLLSFMEQNLSAIRNNVTGFCRSFDHENAGKPLTQQTRYAVESAVAFLSGDVEK